jgi:hypothetical protein
MKERQGEEGMRFTKDLYKTEPSMQRGPRNQQSYFLLIRLSHYHVMSPADGTRIILPTGQLHALPRREDFLPL